VESKDSIIIEIMVELLYVMIPGSIGLKSDASLLARGFLNVFEGAKRPADVCSAPTATE
jgi:hypothetical protein